MYLQGRSRDADVENGYLDTRREGEGGMNWEIRIDIYTVPYVKQVASGNRELSFVLCDDLDGWEWEAGSKGRGDICVCVCVCVCVYVYS